MANDSDAELEKFLQESLSSSRSSSVAQSRNFASISQLGASEGPNDHKLGNTWLKSTNPQRVSDEAKGNTWLKSTNPQHQSDQELEAKGNTWLKSANPQQNLLQVSMPSIGESKYSNDSLDVSDEEVYSKNLRHLKIVDSSLNETSSELSMRPGLETLEENKDKSKFFAELEAGKETPINYSELNKRLNESLGLQSSSASEYKEDFESMSTRDVSSNTVTEGSPVPQKGTTSPIHSALPTSDDLGSSSGDSSGGSGDANALSPIHDTTPDQDSSGVKPDYADVDKQMSRMSDALESSSDKSSPAKPSSAYDAESQRGFELSPIHRTDASPKSSVLESSSGNSLLSTDAKSSAKAVLQSSSNPRMTTEAPYVRGDTKLLRSRTSKPSLLNTEQPPAPVPASSILPKEMTSSTESNITNSSRADQTQHVFTPLAPIASDHSVKVSDSVHKAESITSGHSKSSRILKPLKVATSSSKSTAGDHNKPPTESVDMNTYDIPVLSSASTEGVAIGHRDGMEGTPMRSEKPLPSSGVDHPNAASNNMMADTLTAVTDMANPSLGGEVSHRNEVSSSHLQPAANNEFSTGILGSRLSHDEDFTENHLDHPRREMSYEGLDMKGLIRAITGEELTSAGRDILESSPMQKVSPEATAGKGTKKFKRTGSAPSGSRGVKQKPEQSRTAPRPKTHLPANSSSKKPTSGASAALSKVRPQSSGKERGSPVINVKSRLPQKTSMGGQTTAKMTAAKTSAKVTTKKSRPSRDKPTQKVRPEYFSSHKEEFDHLTELRGKAESVLADGTRNLRAMADTEKSLRKKLAASPGEEKLVLQNEIEEQEMLLQGYQKENERMCAELAGYRRESKATMTQLYQENQRLTAQLASAKVHLSSEETPGRTSHQDGPASARVTESADRVASQLAGLEGTLEKECGEKRELQSQVKQLELLTHCLEQEVKELKQSNKSAVTERVSVEEVELLKKNHLEEVALLRGKLSQYEDQHKTALDQSTELVQAKAAEIASLQRKVASLEVAATAAANAKSAPTKGSSRGRRSIGEAGRILQLEKQVKELEKIIQKKFPNSLAALVLAANSTAETESNKEVSEARIKELEGCVKELQGILETAEKESNERYAKLQQKYTELQCRFKQQQLLQQQEQQQWAASRSSQLTISTRRSSHPAHPNHMSHEGVEPDTGAEVGSDVSALMKENSELKEKLTKINFELAHQKVQWQGKLAEAERKATLAEEESQGKLIHLKEEHQREVDSLLAKFARETSRMEFTRLLSQLKAREATIVHLREKVECLQFDAHELPKAKAREDQLVQQLKTTSEDLMEARNSQAPEMHHFLLLKSKIASLEERNREFEAKNKALWQQTMDQPSTSEQANIKELEHKWRCELLAKNEEIEQYREEMDSLLAALRVLQQQGASSAHVLGLK